MLKLEASPFFGTLTDTSHKYMNNLIEIFLYSKVKRIDFKRQMVSNWYLTEEHQGLLEVLT